MRKILFTVIGFLSLAYGAPERISSDQVIIHNSKQVSDTVLEFNTGASPNNPELRSTLANDDIVMKAKELRMKSDESNLYMGLLSDTWSASNSVNFLPGAFTINSSGNVSTSANRVILQGTNNVHLVSGSGNVSGSSSGNFTMIAPAFDLIGNTVKFGDGTDGNKVIEADLGLGANNPKLRYNSTDDVWQVSNDGLTFSNMATGTSGGGGGLNSRELVTGQTGVTITFTTPYTLAGGANFFYRNGILMVEDATPDTANEYAEATTTTITLNAGTPAVASDEFELVQF
jgi:hypothetical protein